MDRSNRNILVSRETVCNRNEYGLMQALTMHMMSYAGRAEMQILVAKDIIPDPEFLAECFENALLGMKTAGATLTTK